MEAGGRPQEIWSYMEFFNQVTQFVYQRNRPLLHIWLKKELARAWHDMAK